MLHEEQCCDSEVLQFTSKRIYKRCLGFESGICMPNSKWKNKPCRICSRQRLFCNVFRSCEILDFNCERNGIIDTFSIIVRWIAVESNGVTNTENRFEAYTKLSDLVKVVHFIGFSNITKALKVRRCKRLAVVHDFKSVRILYKPDALCLCIFGVLQQLIYEM